MNRLTKEISGEISRDRIAPAAAERLVRAAPRRNRPSGRSGAASSDRIFFARLVERSRPPKSRAGRRPSYYAMSASIRRAMLIATFPVIALDQLTKTAAHVFAPSGAGRLIVPVHNPDFAFGVAGAAPTIEALLSAAGIVLLGGLAVWAAVRGRFPIWAAAVLNGGALANLIDRIAFGMVRDFISIGPVIANLADFAIVTGLAGCAFGLVRARRPALEGR